MTVHMVIMGSISKKDVLILISYSGTSEELKNIIKYANRNKITLIGIVSKKNSLLYKASDIKLHIPEVVEAGLGNCTYLKYNFSQLSIGDALAVATLNTKKRLVKKILRNITHQVSLGTKLRTVEDLMLMKEKIPFINENSKHEKCIKNYNIKKVRNVDSKK